MGHWVGHHTHTSTNPRQLFRLPSHYAHAPCSARTHALCNCVARLALVVCDAQHAPCATLFPTPELQQPQAIMQPAGARKRNHTCNTRPPPRRPTCIAPMVNWSQLCTAQLNRPLQQLQQANYGSGIFAVSAVVRVCCTRALRVLLMRRAGCFVRGCCSVQRDVVCAVGEAAGSDAA